MKTRIWNLTKAFPGKVNFIDSNNVILGYDLNQSCCENAFWTIGESQDGSSPLHRGDNEMEQEIELDGYRFDPKYFERIEDDGNERYVAIFKLIHASEFKWVDGKLLDLVKLPELYLRLENHHNGYYSHGFTFRGESTIEGSL